MAARYWDDWDQKEILKHIGHMDQVAGIHAVQASDGRARGSRMFLVWTGSGLSFHVLTDRGLDIFDCRYRGVPLAWISPVAGTHPAYYEPEGVGWLRGFQGGLLTTCGLDQFGAPSMENDEVFGLHGRVSNLPAEQIQTSCHWREGQYDLEIRGKVRQSRVFGENLLLKRCISTQMSSNRIRIIDEVVNEGFNAQPHMILYHFNLGFPLVSPDTQLLFEVDESVPRDPAAEAGLDSWWELQSPTHGYQEQVFRHRPVADDQGNVHLEVTNPRLGLGVKLTYKNEHLPYLFQWKMMSEGTYVLGMEPANCGVLQGRAIARERGDLPMLEPGESCHYELTIEVVDTAESVQ
jgi:hypothetical protein